LPSVQGWHSAQNPLPSVQWWHSAKYIEIIFVECHQGDTRQRKLCRVPDRGHLAKIILKLKKNLCRVPDHGHSAKSAYIALSNSFLLLSLSYRAAAATAPAPRRRRARVSPCAGPPPCPRLPVAHSPAHRELACLWQNCPNCSSLSA
jgi:hypothetical protein